MSNRYEYFGTVIPNIVLLNSEGMVSLFGLDGGSIVESNPYTDVHEFFGNMNNEVTRFSYDQFINNVSLPFWIHPVGTEGEDEGMIINTEKHIFWYDAVKDVWIMTFDNIMYHIFQ